MKITLRKCNLTKGRQRLFLEIYPPAFNPVTGKHSGYENLRLFAYASPKNELDRRHNKETLQLAEIIRARRQLDIQCLVHGYTPNYQRLQSFKVYFRKMADRSRGMSRHNWDSSVRYFDLFIKEDVRFVDLNLSLCEDFKAFLKSGPKLREKRAGIGHNSALSYYNKFRTALKMAWREKLIPDDLRSLSQGLKEKEAHVEFLDNGRYPHPDRYTDVRRTGPAGDALRRFNRATFLRCKVPYLA